MQLLYEAAARDVEKGNAVLLTLGAIAPIGIKVMSRAHHAVDVVPIRHRRVIPR